MLHAEAPERSPPPRHRLGKQRRSSQSEGVHAYVRGEFPTNHRFADWGLNRTVNLSPHTSSPLWTNQQPAEVNNKLPALVSLVAIFLFPSASHHSSHPIKTNHFTAHNLPVADIKLEINPRNVWLAEGSTSLYPLRCSKPHYLSGCQVILLLCSHSRNPHDGCLICAT